MTQRPWKVELKEIVEGMNLVVDGQVIGYLDFTPMMRDGKNYYQLVIDNPKGEEPVAKVIFEPGKVQVSLHRDIRLETDHERRGIHYGEDLFTMPTR